MNPLLRAWLRRILRWAHFPTAGLAVALLAACGGGDGAAVYRTVAMTGELIDYQFDAAGLNYRYTITESQFGLTGTRGSGTLTRNANGSYTPSGAPDARVVALSNGILLGAVRERFGDAVETTPFIGLGYAMSMHAGIDAHYNYVHRGCVAAQCQASYGTLRVDASGDWRLCREGDLAAGACAGTAAKGRLEPQGNGLWRVRSDDGTDIGTATALGAAGQKVLVIDLKDRRVGGLGIGMLVGGEQAFMTPAVTDGSWIAGMNTGTWFGFTANGDRIDITQLNWTPANIAVSIQVNAPWTGMATTAWGEIGFISGAGLYLLMTPGGDLELGVKLN